MAAIDVEVVLKKLTNPEKISLLAGPSRPPFSIYVNLTVSQELTSGTPKVFQNMEFRPCVCQTDPMVSAAPNSSMAPKQHVSPVEPLWEPHSTPNSFVRPVSLWAKSLSPKVPT